MMPADLDKWVAELKPQAMAAASCSYSPYSRLQVGAATHFSDHVYSGCNVENASFSLTQCAERNALHQAVAGGAEVGKIPVLLIYSKGDATLSPCGACRQVIVELMAEDGVVIATSDSSAYRSWSVAEMLPDAFSF